MNLSKSVIFPLKNGNLSNISGIPIRTTVAYLGVIICKDKKMRNDLNFDPIIRKTNNRFNMWLFYLCRGGSFCPRRKEFPGQFMFAYHLIYLLK